MTWRYWRNLGWGLKSSGFAPAKAVLLLVKSSAFVGQKQCFCWSIAVLLKRVLGDLLREGRRRNAFNNGRAQHLALATCFCRGLLRRVGWLLGKNVIFLLRGWGSGLGLCYNNARHFQGRVRFPIGGMQPTRYLPGGRCRMRLNAADG